MNNFFIYKKLKILICLTPKILQLYYRLIAKHNHLVDYPKRETQQLLSSECDLINHGISLHYDRRDKRMCLGSLIVNAAISLPLCFIMVIAIMTETLH